MGRLRRICVVTGTRADYGLLRGVMQEIRDAQDLELQVMATAMHLSPEFGLTYRAIEEDGFVIDARVEMLLSSDTSVGIAKSTGLGLIGAAEAFERLKPDIVVLLGDRFEALAVAQAALFARIPLAHIAGGDTTEGTLDESMRHAITKMAHIHFATNEEAGWRLRQMGEDPKNIHVVGSPGLDQLRQLTLLDRQEVVRRLGFRLKSRNLLITYHPATLGVEPAESEYQQILAGLESLGPDVGLIFTLPNADPQGRALIQITESFVAARENAAAFVSLGQLLYLSVMAQVDAVVGNSSSGLYEAPSLGKPTVDIGERQRGRLRADSVIHCEAKAEQVRAAVEKAFAQDCRGVVNPYGDGYSSRRIVGLLRRIPDPTVLLQKHFHSFGDRL